MDVPTSSPVRYDSDLTDAEWEELSPLIPPSPPGYERTVNMREILNGIFYKLRSGCPWRYIPKDLPKWRTIYDYFHRFQQSGLWERMNNTLREKVRRESGRTAQPTAAIIDSQTVKTTEKRGSVAMMEAKR